ncbi:GyrI-like domain-containing protein [Aeribacillus alveayuensis]|uniref:Transcriptional regulator YdeE n=1 Tax=Aeribacillus alveayuensis TaxID=279215 RepID=A0ABT9VPD3_9BACI|nr:putative transcriptional regulator YdeE [Bacillus alveayuensis]
MSQFIQTKKIARLDPIRFIGKPVVTSNEAEMKGEGVIPSLWQSFNKHSIIEKIPNKKNPNILAIYTNYESDEAGSYTFAIGAEVTTINQVPTGMKSFFIRECPYVVFTTRKGSIPEIVVEAWQYIWEWSKTNKRAFLTDFEVYDERCKNPENSQVDIYISVIGDFPLF